MKLNLTETTFEKLKLLGGTTPFLVSIVTKQESKQEYIHEIVQCRLSSDGVEFLEISEPAWRDWLEYERDFKEAHFYLINH